MKSRIIPTVFAKTKKEFEERFSKIIKIAPQIQIDFMDGKFVKAKSIELEDVPNLRKYKNEFEAHLMLLNPKKWLIHLKNKGFKKVIFHYESLKREGSIREVIEKIKAQKMEAWIALNPETPIKKIFPFLKEVDGVLFLGVHPGKEHQNFIPQVYEKIKELRKISQGIKIQVDGGVNFQTASKLANLQVNYLNSGSFLSEAGNPRKRLAELQKVFAGSK